MAKWMACDMADGFAFVLVCALPGLLFAAAIALLMLASAACIMAQPERNGFVHTDQVRDLKIARPVGEAQAASPACAAA